jgi:hypothetical protein
MARHVFEWCFDMGRRDRDHPEKDTLFLNRIPYAQFFEAQVFVGSTRSHPDFSRLPSRNSQQYDKCHIKGKSRQTNKPRNKAELTGGAHVIWQKEVSSPEGWSLHNQKGETGA